MIKEKWFSRSAEVIWPQIGGVCDHLRSKSIDFQTKTPNFGNRGSFVVKIKKKKSGPKITSSETRGLGEESGPQIASSEAKGLRKETVPPIASSEARGWKEETVSPIASSEARG